MGEAGPKTDVSSGPNSDGILVIIVGETLVKSVDFAGDDLATGESLSGSPTPSFTIVRDDGMTWNSGVDVTVASHSISGTKIILELTNGVNGVGYEIQILVSTDAATPQRLFGSVRIVAQAPRT